MQLKYKFKKEIVFVCWDVEKTSAASHQRIMPSTKNNRQTMKNCPRVKKNVSSIICPQ